jgi:peptide/nickel transport system substrate-binding protein
MKKCVVVLLLLLVPLILSCIPIPQVYGLERITCAKYGGTLVEAEGLFIKSLNPVVVYDVTAANHVMNIYNNLIDLDRTWKPIPVLASSWEISSDGLVYTFPLQKNVKWHDGQPFTAADVKFTFDAIMKRESGYNKDLLKPFFDRAEVVDDYTVKLILKEANAGFLALLADPYSRSFVILPRHIYEGTDIETNPANESPIGTGPFKFVEWVKGSHLSLVANEEYFLGRPCADKYVMLQSTSASATSAAFETGEVVYGMSSWLPLSPLDVVTMSQDPRYTVDLLPSMRLMHVAFNMRIKPFNNLLVRLAMGHALDLDKLAQLSHPPMKQGEHHIYFTGHWATNPATLQPAYDPQKAEQLLDEAGYPRGADGIRFKTKLNYDIGHKAAVLAAEVLKDMWKKVGIDLELQPLEWAVYVSSIIEGVKKNPNAFEVSIMGGAQTPDPSVWEVYFGTDKYRNIYGFSNSRVDELFTLGRSTADIEERKKYYYEIQELILAEFPRVNIYPDNDYGIASADWRNFWFQIDNWPYQDQSTAYWVKGRPATTQMTTETTELATTQPVVAGISAETAIAAAVVAVIVLAGVGFYLSRRRKDRSPERTVHTARTPTTTTPPGSQP